MDSLHNLQEAMHNFFHAQGLEHTYWVAFSGGLDSQVLLSLCVDLRATLALKFAAIHINHGLSPNAKAWGLQCRDYCKKHAISYVERKVVIERQANTSIEDEARKERYAAIADIMGAGDILLTAHQQDDQAETLLIQLLRGAGPKGLAAMPMLKPFAKGKLARPLLTFSRKVLHDYALHRELTWIEDETNTALNLTRNFIRHQIIPELRERWPSVNESLAKSAGHCAEVQGLLEEYGANLCEIARGSRANTLSLQKLLMLTPEKQKLVLRTWIERNHHPLPPSKKLAAILNYLLPARVDRMPEVNWNNTVMRRYRDDLYLLNKLPPLDVTTDLIWDLDLSQSCMVPGVGELQARKIGRIDLAGKGLSLVTTVSKVAIRFREGGEWIKIKNRGKHSLKHLFQEWGVPVWERGRVPLLYVGDELVAVMGFWGGCVAEKFLAVPGDDAWEVVFSV